MGRREENLCFNYLLSAPLQNKANCLIPASNSNISFFPSRLRWIPSVLKYQKLFQVRSLFFFFFFTIVIFCCLQGASQTIIVGSLQQVAGEAARRTLAVRLHKELLNLLVANDSSKACVSVLPEDWNGHLELRLCEEITERI